MTQAIHPWRRGSGFFNTTVGPNPDGIPAVYPVARTPKDPPEVATALLRAAFERSGMSKGELATKMGFVRANIDHLNRTLGYRPDGDSRIKKRTDVRQRMSYALASRLCEAMGASPIDCGV